MSSSSLGFRLISFLAFSLSSMWHSSMSSPLEGRDGVLDFFSLMLVDAFCLFRASLRDLLFGRDGVGVFVGGGRLHDRLFHGALHHRHRLAQVQALGVLAHHVRRCGLVGPRMVVAHAARYLVHPRHQTVHLGHHWVSDTYSSTAAFQAGSCSSSGRRSSTG